MISDIKIAQNSSLQPVLRIGRKIGLTASDLDLYGRFKAKINFPALSRIKPKKSSKYILVTSITPTPFGEGKTTCSIGLSMAFNRMRSSSIVCLRQPSLGPLFGIKGGAAGGGYSQVLPMEDFNLHFTGDTHAVTSAHNLCAAFLDNAIYHSAALKSGIRRVEFNRVMDINDRALRGIAAGTSLKRKFFPYHSGFDISNVSEVMSILSLASDLSDLRSRLGKIVLGTDGRGRPVTAEDIGVSGAMAVLLKDAVKPNLVQTIENTPCLAHTGPFANISHGCSSIIADKVALGLCDFVVTEAGFGADCGAEKFFDIKCRASGLHPDAAVMVVSVRALKIHSGRFDQVSNDKLKSVLSRQDILALTEGASNLRKQIDNIALFGVPVVVAINRFPHDTDKEIDALLRLCRDLGVQEAVVTESWEKGGAGSMDLARAVERVCRTKPDFHFLYPLNMGIDAKIQRIATKIYGAGKVSYSGAVRSKIKEYQRRGWGNLPVCMAKTRFSLSHDPRIKGAPSGFVFPVNDLRACIGAGFIYALCGKISTMPGLPLHPAGKHMDISDDGRITGMS